MLRGIDVASYQGPKPDFSECDVVGIKVTEGLTYINEDLQSQIDDARAHRCGIVFYHYPHIAESVSGQLQHFLTALGKNLTNADVLCLDWEWYGQNVSNDAARSFKDQWLKDIRAARKNKNVVYADMNNWKNVDTDNTCGDGLWIADYANPAGKPDVNHWFGHQYSDRPEDEDVWNFPTKSAFISWAEENFAVASSGTANHNTPNGDKEMPSFEVGGNGGGVTFAKGSATRVSFFVDNTLALGESNLGIDLRVVVWADGEPPQILVIRVHNTDAKQVWVTFAHPTETHSVTVTRADNYNTPVYGCVS